MKKLHKSIFFVLLILLPVNLGKHFISVDAYVRSKLIDYLVPTIWFQDVLIFCLLLSWIFSGDFIRKVKNYSFSYRGLLTVLACSFLPSLVVAGRFESAFYFFVVFLLRLFLLGYIWFEIDLKTEFPKIVKIFSFQIVFLCLIGIIQWVKQSSLFSNYLFLGEQVYDKTTFNIARTLVNGEQKIPAYSIFRHPNIFGGYLSILFVWIFYYFWNRFSMIFSLQNLKALINKKSDYFKVEFDSFVISRDLLGSILFLCTLTVSFIGIVLTFSQIALLSVGFGLVFYFLIKIFGRKGVFLSLIATFVIILAGILFPVFPKVYPEFAQNPSVYRRVNLMESAYLMINDNFLWGVGVNNFTVNVPKYLPITQVLSFNQPVHNILILIFAENGVFSLLVFLFLLSAAFCSVLKEKFGIPIVLFLNLLQILILGSFDHYFYTVNQTQLLFLLTVGFSLTYTKHNV
jgi:hypothetical protein